MPKGYDDQFTDFHKSARITLFGQELFCLDCGRKMMARRDDDGEWLYVHYSASECVNAGKRFKVATVELEEM